MGEVLKRFNELTDRERDILLKIAELYIKEGEPVGSRTLQKAYSLPFSPATIRNVMADLEDKGYLFQPHTSAGRVPTDKGLKVYINSLFLALGQEDEGLLNRLLDYLKSQKVTDSHRYRRKEGKDECQVGRYGRNCFVNDPHKSYKGCAL